jgi:hypothetical protein
MTASQMMDRFEYRRIVHGLKLAQRRQPMNSRMSTLERAFQLAKSGSASNIRAIRSMLRKEGYECRQIEGGSLLKQLRAMIDAATAKNQPAL